MFDTAGTSEEALALVQQLPQAILDKKSPVLLLKQGNKLAVQLYSQVHFYPDPHYETLLDPDPRGGCGSRSRRQTVS